MNESFGSPSPERRHSRLDVLRLSYELIIDTVELIQQLDMHTIPTELTREYSLGDRVDLNAVVMPHFVAEHTYEDPVEISIEYAHDQLTFRADLAIRLVYGSGTLVEIHRPQYVDPAQSFHVEISHVNPDDELGSSYIDMHGLATPKEISRLLSSILYPTTDPEYVDYTDPQSPERSVEIQKVLRESRSSAHWGQRNYEIEGGEITCIDDTDTITDINITRIVRDAININTDGTIEYDSHKIITKMMLDKQKQAISWYQDDGRHERTMIAAETNDILDVHRMIQDALKTQLDEPASPLADEA